MGFDSEKLKNTSEFLTDEKENAEHTRTGLSNTERLLKILYGKQYKMEIHGEKGKGTIVSIVLPIEKEKRYVESNGG